MFGLNTFVLNLSCIGRLDLSLSTTFNLSVCRDYYNLIFPCPYGKRGKAYY